ncbi:hypothetical protein [Comamonas testosteroni]|uniref:hypothetical protein n=1 Tax=Comamonas testosteroni TaxID=285 RepID=UPI0012D7BF54|nr:hypothetical protein [Comamonas testosteroni]
MPGWLSAAKNAPLHGMRWAGLATDYKQEYRSLIDCNGPIASASERCCRFSQLYRREARREALAKSQMNCWFSWIPLHIKFHDNQLSFVEQFNTNH